MRLLRFINETGIAKGKLAESLGMVPNNISNILSGQRGMPVKAAVKMAKLYGEDATYWSWRAEKELTDAENKLKCVREKLGL